MVCLSGFEVYSRWVPLVLGEEIVKQYRFFPEMTTNIC